MQFLYTGTSLVIHLNGKPVTCANTHVNFDKIVNALKEDASETTIRQLIDMKEVVMKEVPEQVSKNIIFKDGIVFYKESPIPSTISKRINEMAKLGFNIIPMLKFVENLYDNPSYRATQELLGFLECNELPITEDGHFLAYKKIRNDYTDIFSGSFDNSVGKVCEMPRNQVNEDQNVTCSVGLHFASFSYMSSFGDYGEGASDRLVVLKINPRDVVAIPTDYNNAKGRCCKYTVIEEIKNDGKEEIPDDFVAGYNDCKQTSTGEENENEEKKLLIHKYVKYFGPTSIDLTEISNKCLSESIATGNELKEPDYKNIDKNIGKLISARLNEGEITYSDIQQFTEDNKIILKYGNTSNHIGCGKYIRKWLNRNSHKRNDFIKEFGLEINI